MKMPILFEKEFDSECFQIIVHYTVWCNRIEGNGEVIERKYDNCIRINNRWRRAERHTSEFVYSEYVIVYVTLEHTHSRAKPIHFIVRCLWLIVWMIIILVTACSSSLIILLLLFTNER